MKTVLAAVLIVGLVLLLAGCLPRPDAAEGAYELIEGQAKLDPDSVTPEQLADAREWIALYRASDDPSVRLDMTIKLIALKKEVCPFLGDSR